MNLQALLLALALGAHAPWVFAQTETQPPAAAASEVVASQSKLPRLRVAWDCGDCVRNEKVAPLLEQAYGEAARKDGRALSDAEDAAAETVEVTIVDYRQRPPAARVMLGFLAGKDRLGVKLRFRGKELQTSDYSANSMLGMNALCEAVGKQSYELLSKEL